MHKVFRLPRCPYCHKRVSYLGSMFLKTKGEYNCESCQCISNVYISKVAYAIASVVCILALLIVVIYSFIGDHGNLIGLIFLFVPFLLFYIFVPLLVRLVPCKDKSAVTRLKDKSIPNMPSEAAYQQALSHQKAKPVKLDVEEDFSTRFMKAKNHTQVMKAITEPAAVPTNEPDLPEEDLGQTKVALDLTQNADQSDS